MKDIAQDVPKETRINSMALWIEELPPGLDIHSFGFCILDESGEKVWSKSFSFEGDSCGPKTIIQFIHPPPGTPIGEIHWEGLEDFRLVFSCNLVFFVKEE